MAESIRLFRADLKTLWNKCPWWPAETIWFAPRIETDFTAGCRRAGLSLSETAPVVLNNLRWAWRRHELNHDDIPGWQRALATARKRQEKIGLPPNDYVHRPPDRTPPTDPRIKVVTRRAGAFEPAARNPVVDRATRSMRRRRKTSVPETPRGFDWRQFLQDHWLDVFSSLWRSHGLDGGDVDGEIGRLLAVTYKTVLDSQPDAIRSWNELLRGLGQRECPEKRALRTPLPLLGSLPVSRPVVSPDNDEWLANLVDRIEEK
jgi:hypothetical protein